MARARTRILVATFTVLAAVAQTTACDSAEPAEASGLDSPGASTTSDTGAKPPACESLHSQAECDDAFPGACLWVAVHTSAEKETCASPTDELCVAVEIHGQDCGPIVDSPAVCGEQPDGASLQPSYFRELKNGDFQFIDHQADQRPVGWASCFEEPDVGSPPGCSCDCANVGDEIVC